MNLICGIDEAGRGALAGPVCAAAVILPKSFSALHQLNDSKKLSANVRERLAIIIKNEALWATAFASPHTIDKLNILQATLVAMQLAYHKLNIKASKVLVDGNKAPNLNEEVQTIIKGDSSEACIMAASILAKTTRDTYMIKLMHYTQGFNFAQHKGYPTAAHYTELEKEGVSCYHRQSFFKKHPINAKIKHYQLLSVIASKM
jgi:ribonuclease HII